MGLVLSRLNTFFSLPTWEPIVDSNDLEVAFNLMNIEALPIRSSLFEDRKLQQPCPLQHRADSLGASIPGSPTTLFSSRSSPSCGASVSLTVPLGGGSAASDDQGSHCAY